LEELQARHETIACDLRGHGATPGRAHECSIEHYGGDVAALLNNLGFAKAVLVGHSMGTRVVLEAARIEPDSAEAEMRASIEAVGYAAFVENAFRQMGCSDAILERARRLPAETGAALWARMVRWDAAHMDEALAAVHAPLMVIQSTTIDHNRQRRSLRAGQSTQWLELVREKVPGARIEVIPGAGHFTQLDAADEVNRLLAAFPWHPSVREF